MKFPPSIVEKLGRLGYAAKGAVYTSAGLFSLLFALGLGGGASGSQATLHALDSHRYGDLLLAPLAAGLAAYVLWRFIQSLTDTDDKGSDLLGIVKRTGYFISGLVYGGLSFSAIRRVFRGGSGEGQSAQGWVRTLLEQPAGPWLIIGVGLILVGVGGFHFYRGLGGKFQKELQMGSMNAAQKRLVRGVGYTGITLRGLLFLISGIFLIRAGFELDASKVKGVSGSLQVLREQAYGEWLFAAGAAGLTAYGLYALLSSVYRRF